MVGQRGHRKGCIVKVTVETGPPGDHEPEVYEGECLMVETTDERYLQVSSWPSGSDRYLLGSFNGDDWTTVTIDQSMDPI